MKAIMVMFDTLSRRFLSSYGNDWVKTPNFERLKEKSAQFNNFYSGSLPCMPARRELHTGRYNFLHRGWGPLEPFDLSAMELLKKHGVYTHIATDHSHYWEDGGATYLPRYSSWEGFRGQEGDRWVGLVHAENRLSIPEQAKTSKSGESFYVNYASRERMVEEKDFSSVKSFQAGLDFIEKNHEEDRWFLQIESFDPHEPFYVPQKYLDLYEAIPSDVVFDWPPSAPVCESEAEKRQVIIRYAALISMCDAYLGKVLDAMDAYQMWDDTMLLVNTDHGFLMGEHEWWGKNVQPAYNEVVHLPFYLYDPRSKIVHEERNALCQSIDIAPTLLDFFGLEIPSSMQGKSLGCVVEHDTKIREAALFGSFGGHINVTDGTYVYMRSSKDAKNQPLYEYTLMPTAMRGFLNKKALSKSTLTNEFNCFQNMNVLKIPGSSFMSSYRYGNKLFNIKQDSKQVHLLDDVAIEVEMLEKMRQVMIENEAPIEQYERIGIEKEQAMNKEDLLAQRAQRITSEQISLSFHIDEKEKAQILMLRDMMPEGLHQQFYQSLEEKHGTGENTCKVIESFAFDLLTKQGLAPGHIHMFMGLLKNASKTD